MEPAGLAVGVLALAGLFNNAVDCFNYVQVGRAFGTKTQVYLLRLGNLQLRLSRWGEAVGLTDIQNIQSLNAAFSNPKDTRRASRLLGQILELFDEAREASEHLGGFVEDETALDGEEGGGKDPVDTTIELRSKMKDLAMKRQNKATLAAKVRWALTGRDKFTALLEDISTLVKDLEDLFPGRLESRRELAIAEVQKIATPETASLLKECAKSSEVEDELLEQAVLIHQNRSQNAIWSRSQANFGANNSGTQLGQITSGSGGVVNINLR